MGRENRQWPLSASVYPSSTACSYSPEVKQFLREKAKVLSYHAFGSWIKAAIDSLSLCMSPWGGDGYLSERRYFNRQTFKVMSSKTQQQESGKWYCLVLWAAKIKGKFSITNAYAFNMIIDIWVTYAEMPSICIGLLHFISLQWQIPITANISALQKCL